MPTGDRERMRRVVIALSSVFTAVLGALAGYATGPDLRAGLVSLVALSAAGAVLPLKKAFDVRLLPRCT